MPFQVNINRFKEPRAFLKIIQFLVAILAFSTTAGYHSEFIIRESYSCTSGTVNQHLKVKFGYPFDEKDGYVGAYKCNRTSYEAHQGPQDFPSSLKSSSQFFVFVGVVTFLYCIVAMVYYICFEDPSKYAPGGTGKVIRSFATLDFVVTIILAFIWFCGSAAWAAGLTKLKDETDPDDYITKYCQRGNCDVIDKANYAGITISVLFGFLSCFLWIANVWFVFKETVWHKEASDTVTAEQPSVEIPRQEVPGEEMP